MDCSILVVNKTTENVTNDSFVALYIYHSWDSVCWLPSETKIIYRGDKYLYRSEGSFKFKIEAKEDGKKMKTLWPTTMWEKDTLFLVTGPKYDPKIEAKNLSEYPQERQLFVRRQNMESEIPVDSGRNLYEILGLNMKEVRGKTLEEQNEMIKKAYRREIRRWHPDRNQEVVDDHICGEIIVAYDILRDPEKRARYNNEADYNNGWLSKSRWKSIFWPDCYTKEQKKEYKNRLHLMALSAGLVIGGIFLTGLTAGMAAHVAIAATAALMGGGVQSGLRTISRESIKDGCDFKKYLKSLAIGAIGGAALGPVGTGITVALEFKQDEHGQGEREQDEAEQEEPRKKNIGRIGYLCERRWVSKMIVKYVNDQREEVQKEVRGSGKSIDLPETARDVQVRFQVMRFPGKWCDVKKYDRFNKCWCEPTEPHIFKYKRSITRTFTIGGPLYFEAVLKVTGEFYEELHEM